MVYLSFLISCKYDLKKEENKPLFLRHLSRMNLKNNFRRKDGIFNQYESNHLSGTNSNHVLLIKYLEGIHQWNNDRKEHIHMKGRSSTHHKFGSSGKSSLYLPLLLYKFVQKDHIIQWQFFKLLTLNLASIAVLGI